MIATLSDDAALHELREGEPFEAAELQAMAAAWLEQAKAAERGKETSLAAGLGTRLEAAIRQRGYDTTHALFQDWDENGDGTVSKAEYVPQQPSSRSAETAVLTISALSPLFLLSLS